jgi:hypothetical protein
VTLRARSDRHGVVRFSGRVTGAAIPPVGLLVNVQVANRGLWPSVSTVHTTPTGRFNGRYRFGARRPEGFLMRAEVLRQTGWRLFGGHSRRIRVHPCWLLLASAVGLTALLTGVASNTIDVTQLYALRAAGLNGQAPANADAIKTLIDTLTENWKWLIISGAGFVMIVVAGLFMAGSQRAPDWLFKFIGGMVLILVVIPAALK